MDYENAANNTDNLVDVDMTPASDIQSVPISWLYEPYFPIGTVVLCFGEGGEGKSFYSLALAAAISNGALLPGMTTPFPASNVIVINAENPWPSVLKPRLEMLGADCSKIFRINDGGNRLTLTDDRIEAAIRKHNVKLCIIDPIQSHLPPSMSMGRAESVRPMLTHLEAVAERTQSCIILIGHVTKGNGKAQHRGLGSIDIINSVPSVMYLGRAASLDRDVRAVAQGKNNFSELGVTQLFRLNKKDGFSWIGESDITPDDILSFNARKNKEEKSKIDEAAEFLLAVLADGAVPANEVMEQADDMEISRKTLERARKAADVKSKRVDGHWVWSV